MSVRTQPGQADRMPEPRSSFARMRVSAFNPVFDTR